ncbi:transposase [Pseudomonas sp. Leaf58]|uniref:transposase n=1 Tax=Pseudomonas sp. Leaf58 TaxID=1736226 RepID=UPI0021159CA7
MDGTRPALNHSTIAVISCVRSLWPSPLFNKDSRIVFKILSERNTAQSCSNYQQLPDSRTIGIAGLGIREWICNGCGVTHDRDANGAKKIPALGHERPTVRIPFQSKDSVGGNAKPPFAISLDNYCFNMGIGRMHHRRN